MELRVHQILLLTTVTCVLVIAVYYKFYKPPITILVKSDRNRERDLDLQTPGQFLHERLTLAESVWAEQVLKRQRNTYFYSDNQRIVWDFYYPTFTCPYLVERIGRIGDGGKWVCGLEEVSRGSSNGPCVVYSYGVSRDTSFEDEILQKTNCSVYGFDHTVPLDGVRAQMARKYPNRTSFLAFGLGVKDEGSLRTLGTEMNMNGHKFIDILKVDVEGAESGIFPQIVQYFNGTFPFGELLIEIHLGKEWGLKTHKALKEWWEILEGAGMRPFSKEVNAGPKDLCCFEVSFLNVRNGVFEIPSLTNTTSTAMNATNLLNQTRIKSK